jgi:hypothetical protein
MPTAGMAAMLAKADALPGAEGEPSAGDGNGQRTAQQGRFYMARHVVRPFHRVSVRKIFRRNRIKRSIEINQYVGIGVLVDRQRCRRVLQEDLKQADANFRNFGHRLKHQPRNRMDAARKRRQDNFTLEPSGHIVTVLMGVIIAP